MKKYLLLLACLCVMLSTSVLAMDPKLEGIISRLKANQGKIKDMSAQIITTIKSDMKEKKTLEQKGSIKVKGEDRSRMEMTAPIEQVTITNKDKMAIINSATGQKFVQDLKKLRKQSGRDDVGGSPIDQTKALDYFDLTLEEKGIIQKSYIITGIPKEKNKFMGKMKFYIDAGRDVPTKIEIFNPQGKTVSTSDIEYTNIKDIWVVSKNTSKIEVPGGRMEVEMRFEDIKINEGIPDKEFEIK